MVAGSGRALMWDWLFSFIDPLNRAGIPYAIVGSVASGVYGEPRATNDVDLLILIRPDDVAALVSSFPEDDFYITPAETILEELARGRGAHFNVIAQHLMMKADFYPSPEHDVDWLARRQRGVIEGREVWLASPESVILHKLLFMRESGFAKHGRDIRGMLAVSGGLIDFAWLEERIQQLGLVEQWRIVRGEPSSPNSAS